MSNQSDKRPPTVSEPTDYRKLRKQGERRTLYLVLFVLVIVGDLLIGLVFGWGAMLAALPWLILFGCGIAALFLFLDAMERWSR